MAHVLVGTSVCGVCVGGYVVSGVCVCVLVGKLGGSVCWWVSCECVYVGV